MKRMLLLPVLLSAAGGYLDTFGWLFFGHVFTNAQTGNIILFGVAAAGGHWWLAARHVPPMLGFFPGIFAAQLLRERCGPDALFGAAIVSLSIEILALIVVGLLPPGTWNVPVVFTLAFVAALQSTCFDSVGRWSYTSVVTTGNLRTLGKAFYHGVFPRRDPDAREKARIFAVICTAFAAGAVGGGILSQLLGRIAIAVPVLLLGLALVTCGVERALARREVSK